ncbi:MAG: glycosyltransferase [Thermoanaerobaculia bacterium]
MDAAEDTTALPRLLYVGDVPVSNTVAGASLLYRLLVDYPVEKLRICGPPCSRASALPGVVYDETTDRFPRLLRTRLAPWYCAWITWRLLWTPKWLRRIAAEFRPEAILTVSQTGRWLAATRLAKALEVPLLLIAHDDHAFMQYLPQTLRPWITREFAAAYRKAAARFCVSPAMCEVYLERYGVSSTLLYPSQDRSCAEYSLPPARLDEDRKSLTFAYAGSVHDAETFRQLGDFCALVEKLGHRLLIYSPQSDELRVRLPLKEPAESVRGPVAPHELATLLRSEADALLVLGSFGADQREVVSTLFPSKMAHYTGLGLPIVCWAPEYASISRFLRDYPGVALASSERELASLRPALDRLRDDPALRHDLAIGALRVGRALFGPAVAGVAFRAELNLLANRKTLDEE